MADSSKQGVTMSYNITSRLEVNIPSLNSDFRAATEFLIKHRCQAIVVLPELVPAMLTTRSVRGGQFKIIASIDFPDGKNFCLDKLKTINTASLNVDGMDILLTRGRTQIDSRNEVKTLMEFLRGTINPLIDIRLVVRCYNASQIEINNFLDAANAHPPSMIRIDQHLDLPHIDVEKHIKTLAMIKEKCGKPPKISGNVDLNTIEKITQIDKRAVFDVSIQQATRIVNQIKQKDMEPAKEPTKEPAKEIKVQPIGDENV